MWSSKPELFYLTFAFYDASNNQKLTANFHWTPDLDSLLAVLAAPKPKATSSSSSGNSNGTINHNLANGGKLHPLASSSSTTPPETTSNANNIFSLNGVDFGAEPLQMLNSELKQQFYARIKKAMFTLLDVHEEIYLVARVEKILDGVGLGSSVQAYTGGQLNDSARLKAALRIYKKMNALAKSKLASYRQPFAWAARPIFKRSAQTTGGYDLDSDGKFSIFKHDEQHLSDDDLFKYLNDLRARERSSKLVSLNGDIHVTLKDFVVSSSS